ncbi:MAG: hypothetical protein Q8Q00_06540 [Dehalococcoidia bacterium]|nr:hypothetical protein [Dehalococcoidia bacterium]
MVIGIVIGVVLTVVGALLLSHLQRERRRLAYEVLTAEVIIPDVRDRSGLHIMVDSALLGASSRAESAEAAAEALTEVKKVYGFRVGLRNVGNAVIENQQISIRLDDSARIISLGVEFAPDLGGESITTNIEPSQPNACSAQVPFLNPSHHAILSIQSVDNGGTTCLVSAGARGLVVYDLAKRRDRIAISGAVAFVLAVAGVLGMWGGAVRIWDDPKRELLGEMLSDNPGGWLFGAAWLAVTIAAIVGFIMMWVISEGVMSKNRMFRKL